MSATLEKTSSIGRKLNVVVPAETIETAVQKRLKQLSKRVKVQGFRPGKVPMKIIEQQYRGTATNDVLGELIQSSLQTALEEQEVTPAVQPDIEPVAPVEKGKDFSYFANFDVYPVFDKLDLEGITVSKPESSIEDTDVDRVIENMRKQQLTWTEKKRKAKKGDRLMVDYTGQIDGDEFDGGSASDQAIVVGDGQMLPEFDQALVGMKAGDTKEVEVSFPDDYKDDLAGKKALFSIQAKSVSEAVLPDVDEEFIKGFGIESGDESELRDEVRSNLETNLETQLSTKTRQTVFDALLEQNELEMPLKMVQQEAARMVDEQKNQLRMQGIDDKLLEKFPAPEFATLKPQAEKRVALGLLMMEIIQKNELKTDDERVNKRIEKMASSYEDPDEFVEYYKNNQQALAQVQSLVLEEQVVDLLLANAQVELEKVEAADILNMQ